MPPLAALAMGVSAGCLGLEPARRDCYARAHGEEIACGSW